jgi:hypothetical protein
VGTRLQRDVVEGGEGPPAGRRGAARVHRGGGGGEELPRRGGAAFRWAGGAGDQAGRARARSEAAGGARARTCCLYQPPGPASELPVLDPRPSLHWI